VKNYKQILDEITREDVKRVAQKYFSGHRIQLRTRTGFPKKDKIAKPGFKALKNNSKNQSEFARRIRETGSSEILPKFISPETDVVQKDLGRGNKLFISNNPYNKLASLKVKFNADKKVNPHYSILPMAMDNATPEGFELKDFKKKQAELNCSVFFYWEKDFLCAEVSGEEGNIFKALSLLRNVISNPQLSATSLELVHSRMQLSVKQEKKRPSEMGRALWEFVLYGNKSEFLNRPRLAELKTISRDFVAGMMKEISAKPGSLHYCGSLPADAVQDSILKYYSLPGSGSIQSFSLQPVLPKKNTIYLVHDKKARQSQVYFSAMADPLRTEDESHYALLNEYLGAGFSGLIVQEIREFRSLAYSAGGRFERLMPKGNPLLFSAYLGCQADKTNEAVKTMAGLIREMPAYPERIPHFKTYFESSISSKYPDFRGLSGQVEKLLLNGYKESPLLPAYRNLKSASFEGMMEFYRNNLQNKPLAITIYGNKKKMDLEKLKEFGEIIELKSSDIIRD
jgi:predicted Zn-dependent peptidase